MAVDYDFLVTDLSIQNQIVDKFKSTDVSQSASGAQVFFYKTDEVTPKNIYIQTDDPLNPFTVAANPQTLNTAGAFEQKIYYYFFDEDDETPTNEELYYIKVVNTDSVTIYETNNFVINPPSSGGGTTTTSLVNLAPDYGFDVLFRSDYYASSTDIYLNEVANYPALGYLWFISDPSIGDFSYEFVAPAIGTLEGDPLHYIILTEENFGSDQTNIWFGFPICQYQELIDSTITFQFLAQDQSNTAVTSLDISIVRSPAMNDITNLVDWTMASSPINVGSVALDTSFSLKTVTFTMPSLVTTPEESSLTYLVIEMPKDQNFKIALTGFYPYQGEGETLAVTRDNLGNRNSRVFAQAMNNFLLSLNDYKSNNQPLMRRGAAGAINYQNRTGIFFQSSSPVDYNDTIPTYNFAVPANAQNVVVDYTYAEAGRTNVDTATEAEREILCNRYFEQVSSSTRALGDNSFLITALTATGFNVQTVLVHTPYSDWVSNSGVLTITPLSNPSNHILTAVIGPSSNQVDMTFTSNYDAGTFAYRDSALQPLGTPQNQYNPDVTGSLTAMVNWFGTITGSSQTAPYLTWNPTAGVTLATLNIGSGATPASVRFTWPVGGLTAAQIRSTQNNLSTNRANWSQYTNTLEFSNVSSSSPYFMLPAIPPYAIQFHVDSQGATVQVSDTLLTINFPSSEITTGADLANFMVNSLSDGTFYNFDFSGVPSNGENFYFSSTYKNFIGIFWITSQVKPTNPLPSRPAIYIALSPTASVQDVVTATSNAFINQISCIPNATDLNITLGNDMNLFMEA